MSKIIKFTDADLGDIYFEVNEKDSVPTRGGLEKIGANDGEGKFEKALDSIKGIASKLINAIVDIPKRPDEVECKIGVTFNVEAGVFIAKTSTEGNLEITLKWKKETSKPT
jgi:Trypsin-co-occurring domain 1